MFTQTIGLIVSFILALTPARTIEIDTFLEGYWLTESKHPINLESVNFLKNKAVSFKFRTVEKETTAFHKHYEVVGYDKDLKIIYLNVYTKDLFSEQKQYQSAFSIEVLNEEHIRLKRDSEVYTLKRKFPKHNYR